MVEDSGFKKPFKDREDAVHKLIDILPLKELQKNNTMCVSISTGGVPIAKEISKKIGTKFDFLFTEPISAPNNPDCQIAIVSETEEIVIHEELVESFNIKIDYIYGEAHRKYEEKIIKYMYKYRKGGMISTLENKNVLFVDEGVDSGLTLMASVKTAIRKGAKSISIATPVMPLDVYCVFEETVDEVYCVCKPADFVSVQHYYESILTVTQEEMDELLKDFLQKEKYAI